MPRLLSLIAPALFAPSALAQCPAWKPGFALAGTDAPVWAVERFDDGSGPKVFAGGDFTRAGEAVTRACARFDGARWSGAGAVLTQSMFAFTTYDSGSGSELYAGGSFLQATLESSFVARWNGTAWVGLGAGLSGSGGRSARAFATFDVGGGPLLAVGGNFHTAGGVSPRLNVAAWNGTAWSGLANGVDNTVQALCAFDDGSGPALYAGGYFTLASGVPASRIARWNGSTWSSVGGGIDDAVHALVVHDDGSGPALYAGGWFTSAGGAPAAHVARWNGTSWSAVSGGVDARVDVLAVHDDGSGVALYAGGGFTHAGGVPAARIARLANGAWSAVGTGFDDAVFALRSIDDGAGPALAAAGTFLAAGGVSTRHIAVWRGTEWRPIETTGHAGTSGSIDSATVVDEGAGPRVLVGGSFSDAGFVRAEGLAWWDGERWEATGAGLTSSSTAVPTARRLVRHDDGGGEAVYAAGYFDSIDGVSALSIAKRTAGTWSDVGGGLHTGPVPSQVYALAEFDDGNGPELFAGGEFNQAGTASAPGIARWTGTSWSSVSGGLSGGVQDLAVVDVGGVPTLFACGRIGTGIPPFPWRVVRRVSGAWQTIVSTTAPIYALAGFDSGSGAELYVGTSSIASFNGQFATALARWNGSTWSNVGGGVTGSVFALERFDDGSGLALYVGGQVTNFGASGILHLAQWDGQSWGALGLGVAGSGVRRLAALDDGTGGGSDLFVFGGVAFAGGQHVGNIAEWLGCSAPAVTSFCAGDGSASPCPCGNFGALGHGCANSGGANGAQLSATGFPSVAADSLVLVGAEMRNGGAIYLQGTARDTGGLGTPLFDGLRCLSGSIMRLGLETNVGGASQYPNAGELPITTRGSVPAPGGQRFYQAWYRDALTSFCPPATANWTNGLAVTWYP